LRCTVEIFKWCVLFDKALLFKPSNSLTKFTHTHTYTHTHTHTHIHTVRDKE
jgi:hypothetical protein